MCHRGISHMTQVSWSMEHPCFISYAHPIQPWARSLTEKVLGAVGNALSIYTRSPPFVDNERLKPGFSPDEVLASAICKSACMVIIYYPAYLESEYCRRELEAMREIEERRRNALGRKLHGRRMFLPIVLRGKVQDLPSFVCADNVPLDYSKQALSSVDISDQSEVREELFTFAESIVELFNLLKDQKVSSLIDCDSFAVPPPSPIDQPPAASPRITVPPFPGRT